MINLLDFLNERANTEVWTPCIRQIGSHRCPSAVKFRIISVTQRNRFFYVRLENQDSIGNSYLVVLESDSGRVDDLFHTEELALTMAIGRFHDNRYTTLDSNGLPSFDEKFKPRSTSFFKRLYDGELRSGDYFLIVSAVFAAVSMYVKFG